MQGTKQGGGCRQGRGLQERVRELASRLDQTQAAAASDTAQKADQAGRLQAELDAANAKHAAEQVARDKVWQGLLQLQF